ncbi:hypothetical protein HMN09_00914900 [Mycena chlorophos]|uniref:Uncharacterized protein n=1 Tax=Mycena chlorophos TaxID=658473 RepID=A0A8H6W287_MYCCL|nr:hypothetical protein HMN09_00914900 [Mycena chlorophos]
MSSINESDLFDAAEELTVPEITAYLALMFPRELADPTHDPYFDIAEAPHWMTARGFDLFQSFNADEPILHWPADGKLKDLLAFREMIVSPPYINHRFFSVGRPDWILPAAFNAWKRVTSELESRGRRSDRGSISPRSRSMSVASVPSTSGISGNSSPRSFSVDSAISGGSSSMVSSRAASPLPGASGPTPDLVESATEQNATLAPSKGKAKARPSRSSKPGTIEITRQTRVDRIIPITKVPRTWPVPRDNAIYRLDLTATPEVLDGKEKGKKMSIDAFMRSEDQDSWGGGSTGSPAGDAWVFGLGKGRVRARRVDLKAPTIQYRMQDLWHQELDANEREASLADPTAFLHMYTMAWSELRAWFNTGTDTFDTNHKFYYEWRPEYEYLAFVQLECGHSHPAMNELDSVNLTVQTLINAPSTAVAYDGKRVSDVSPAFTDVRQIRKRIAAHRKAEFPAGTDWDGVKHYFETHERLLPISQRYIHAAIQKGDFKMIVTLHPQLAQYIHGVHALVIDYTFKPVEDEMDEWEVVGFVTRLNRHWYSQKLANPWILPSVSPFLSKITAEDHAITPSTTNYAESAHAATNALTSTRLALLTGILKKQAADVVVADELRQQMRDAVSRKRWNGPAAREQLQNQRRIWAAKQTHERNEDLLAYDELTEEKSLGTAEWKLSLARQRGLEAEIDEGAR